MMPIYPMDELSNTESNPVMKRLYEKAKDSKAVRVFLFIMIIDEPIMLFLLAKMAFF